MQFSNSCWHSMVWPPYGILMFCISIEIYILKKKQIIIINKIVIKINYAFYIRLLLTKEWSPHVHGNTASHLLCAFLMVHLYCGIKLIQKREFSYKSTCVYVIFKCLYIIKSIHFKFCVMKFESVTFIMYKHLNIT
jgi:hypothetical protein